jgi:transcriptional regulator with XRE-family HTH domain
VKLTASDFFHLPVMERRHKDRHNAEMSENQQQFRPTFIRAWRKHRGLTLEQLAARLGDMVPSNLSMLERGLRGYVQNTLERIAAELGTDASTLLSRGPKDGDDIMEIWDHAKPNQRRQIIEIAKTITRDGESQ